MDLLSLINNRTLPWYGNTKAADHPQALERLTFLQAYLARQQQPPQQPIDSK
jgi:hypothetical protein